MKKGVYGGEGAPSLPKKKVGGLQKSAKSSNVYKTPIKKGGSFGKNPANARRIYSQ